jgi:ketosteroid isomerase-like protein
MRTVVRFAHRGPVTTTETVPSTSGAEARPSNPVDVVQGLYAAFGRGDIAGMLDLIDPDVDWSLQVDAPGGELVPMLRNGRGHQHVQGYFAGVAQLEFHVFEPQAFHVDGDTVLVELALDLSHRTTGKRAQLGEIHRFVVRDGKIVHYRPYVDTATLIDLFRS